MGIKFLLLDKEEYSRAAGGRWFMKKQTTPRTPAGVRLPSLSRRGNIIDIKFLLLGKEEYSRAAGGRWFMKKLTTPRTPAGVRLPSLLRRGNQGSSQSLVRRSTPAQREGGGS